MIFALLVDLSAARQGNQQKSCNLAYGPSPGRDRSTARIFTQPSMERPEPSEQDHVRNASGAGRNLRSSFIFGGPLHGHLRTNAVVGAIVQVQSLPKEAAVTSKLVLTILAPVVFAAMAPTTDASAAVNYPWCAHYMMQNGPKSCGFVTVEQCWATVNGIGGFCEQNPFYVPAKSATPRLKRIRQG
jgi:hypothetical protein